MMPAIKDITNGSGEISKSFTSPIKPQAKSQTKPEGSVLAFDFGEKRIGVATGESLLGIAHPLTTIDAEANDERFGVIAELIKEWQPALLVVGLPLTVDGEEHALTLLCKKFSRRLDGRFGLPVVMVDERYTSVEASNTLKHMGIGGRKQKPMLDAVAAQHILQSYFDGLSQS
jgi:putative holliday junction resolvase